MFPFLHTTSYYYCTLLARSNLKNRSKGGERTWWLIRKVKQWTKTKIWPWEIDVEIWLTGRRGIAFSGRSHQHSTYKLNPTRSQTYQYIIHIYYIINHTVVLNSSSIGATCRSSMHGIYITKLDKKRESHGQWRPPLSLPSTNPCIYIIKL